MDKQTLFYPPKGTNRTVRTGQNDNKRHKSTSDGWVNEKWTRKCQQEVLRRRVFHLAKPTWQLKDGTDTLLSPIWQTRHSVGYFCIAPQMTKSLNGAARRRRLNTGESSWWRGVEVKGGRGGLAAPYFHSRAKHKVNGSNYPVESALVFDGWFHFLPLATAIKC